MKYMWNVKIPNSAKVFVMKNKIKCDRFILSNKQSIWDNYSLCLDAVKHNGWNLRWVNEQTDELCTAAIKQNGNVLMLVQNQTEEICLESVRQNGLNLFNVNIKTELICNEAIKQNDHARRWIKNNYSKSLNEPSSCTLM